MNLNTFLKRHGREVVHVVGDGFCFLRSVCEALKNDYGIFLQIKEVVQLILEQLIENHHEYMNYYIVNLNDEQKKQKKNQPWVTDSDIFVEEAMDFFENRDFNKDIVDILVKVTSDALGINIYIYQKETDKTSQRDYILRVQSMCSNSSKQVHLKFTHNNIHSQGNHYDPIVRHDSSKTNLDILASVAEYATKMCTNDVVCIDSEDEDICEMTTSDEPFCIDVETPQKKSSKVKYDTDEIPEIK